MLYVLNIVNNRFVKKWRRRTVRAEMGAGSRVPNGQDKKEEKEFIAPMPLITSRIRLKSPAFSNFLRKNLKKNQNAIDNDFEIVYFYIDTRMSI